MVTGTGATVRLQALVEHVSLLSSLVVPSYTLQ